MLKFNYGCVCASCDNFSDYISFRKNVKNRCLVIAVISLLH